MFFLKNKRRLTLLSVDFIIMLGVYALSLIVSVFASPQNQLLLQPLGYILNGFIFAFCIFASRMIGKCYSNVWRYANSLVFLKLVVCDAIGGIAAVLITHFINYVDIGLWMGCSFVTMCNIATLASRFVYQLYYRNRNVSSNVTTGAKTLVAILGAGQVGTLLAEELIYDKSSKYKPVCFIDKDKRKIGGKIVGLPVYLQEDSVEKVKALGVEEIFIAIPELAEERTKAIVEFYAKCGFKVKIYAFPIKDDGTSDENAKRVIREVKIEDLLFRDMLKVIDAESKEYYKDKVVLVTGGGGSIGSELSRQIAKCQPKKLVIFDIYENNAYDIEQELRRAYGESLNLTVEIGSVRDRERLDSVFCEHRPEIVFHAAAHKHVPLM